ncbi:MAG: lysophospholipid acyltransferase family protein [Myxococcales bacterium]
MHPFLRSVWAGTTAVGLTGGLAPVVSALSLKDPRNADPVLHFWARQMLKAADVRAIAHGLENVPAEGQCVLVCNHQSHFDALMLFAHIHKHMRFVAKSDLFKIPIFGQAMRLAGNLRVDRSGSEKDRETLRKAADAVRERVSIVFFAEGTRSEGGELLPFKKGAAMLAIQAGVPVVPVAVAGTYDILPKHTLRIRGGQRAALFVGRPLPTSGLSGDDRDRLTAETYDAVRALLRQANAAIGRDAGETP